VRARRGQAPPLLWLRNLQPSQVDDRRRAQEEVHPDQTLDRKTVVHGPDLDFKVGCAEVAQSKPSDAFRKNKFGPADTYDSAKDVRWLRTDSQVRDFVSGKHSAR